MNIIKLLLFVISCSILSYSQNTVGLVNYSTKNKDGYVLFSPMTSTKTFLINKCGEKLHEWNKSSYRPGLISYILNDGSLLRTGILNNPNFDEGGSGGIIEKFDWEGNLTWSYTISDSNNCQHHDIKVLPNGNILVIVWDRYTKEQAIANGKNTNYTNNYLWSEKIVELEPYGSNGANIVWEWKVWDHLVQDFDKNKPNFDIVANHPELVNINYFPGNPTNVDWIHLNSIDYNPELDQILVSSHTLNEIWIIDHSTTKAEAAAHKGGKYGKGGDLLYRWGNPQAYQKGNPTTKKFFGQHHATWIPKNYPNSGKIIVFNNGLNRTGNYSSIDIIEPPINLKSTYDLGTNGAYLPNNVFWTYTAPIPTDFYSSNISGVNPLDNGSFLITSGATGTFFEIDSSKETVWKYINPINQNGISKQGDKPTGNLVFRCEYYPLDYNGFKGKELISLGEIELNPSKPSICSVTSNIDKNDKEFNIDNLKIIQSGESLFIECNALIDRISILDLFGQVILDETIGNNNFNILLTNKGVMFVKLESGLNHIYYKLIKL